MELMKIYQLPNGEHIGYVSCRSISSLWVEPWDMTNIYAFSEGSKICVAYRVPNESAMDRLGELCDQWVSSV